MHAPTTFELRLTTPNGEPLQVGPVTTQTEVSALAHAALGDGRAIRVEVSGRRRGRRHPDQAIVDRSMQDADAVIDGQPPSDAPPPGASLVGLAIAGRFSRPRQ